MDVKEFLSKDRFVKHIGVELIEVADGRAKAKLHIRKNHLNALDMAQGGAIFSLADLALAAAANSHGNIAITINMNISYVKAAGEGTLYAEAHETSRSSRIASYTINISDLNNELIACCQGMVYFKKETFQDD